MPTALVVDDEPLARERIRTLLRNHPGVEVAGVCADGVEAVAAIRHLRPQLLLLDVQMPGLDGFGVLAHLIPREIPVTVFVTAYDRHALRAFEVGAADYVLKPIVRARFDLAVGRALQRLKTGAADVRTVLRAGAAGAWLDRLVVERRGRLAVVPLADVHWLAAEGNYVRVHTAAGAALMRSTLRLLEARLDPARFARIHRSALVALDHVVSVEPGPHGEGSVCLSDGTVLVSARTRTRELRARLRAR